MTRLWAFCMFLLGLLSIHGAAAAGSAHDHAFISIEGDPMPMSGFRGRPVLLVNTASLCGFTPQYEGLQALHETYRDRGLVVLGVPSNDFGGQEPGTEAEIKEFCEVNFQVTFPMTEKQVVRGNEAHSLYKWAREALGPKGVPRWNFHKILIDGDGRAVDAWPSTSRPQSTEIVSAIESVLPD